MDLLYNIKARNFKAKKSLGQNFLVDSDTIDFITRCANSDDEVLEIGPGLGFVTKGLIQNAKNVVSVEIDPDAISVLKKELGHNENFHLIEGDILKTNIVDLPFSANSNENKIKVIANIPYYITSPILAHLLGEIDDINNKNRTKIKKILLMVQLEVARRITADNTASNKEYGALSILSNMWAETKIVKIVPKNCFKPSPKVDSALVEFDLSDKPKVEISRLLKRTVRAIFNQRRKNIKNALLIAGFLNVAEALQNAGFEPTARGEKMSIFDIKKIAVALEEFN